MTQKEKLVRAAQFAAMVRSIGNRIIEECKDYDETWAISYGKELVDKASNILKMLSK